MLVILAFDVLFQKWVVHHVKEWQVAQTKQQHHWFHVTFPECVFVHVNCSFVFLASCKTCNERLSLVPLSLHPFALLTPMK